MDQDTTTAQPDPGLGVGPNISECGGCHTEIVRAGAAHPWFHSATARERCDGERYQVGYAGPVAGPAGQSAPAARYQQAGPPPIAPCDSSVTDEAGDVAGPRPDPRRAESIAALRAIADGYARLADAIELHDAIPDPHLSSFEGPRVILYVHDAAALAAAARALPCDLDKVATDEWLKLNGRLGGLRVQLYTDRDAVCAIVGYEDREVEVEVQPAVTEKVTKSMPVWECAPILAAERSASTA
jgi:hypothetical protein